MNRLSLRWLTLGVVAFIGLFALALTLGGSYFYRNAAIDARTAALGRVMSVASLDILDSVRAQALLIGQAAANGMGLKTALAQWQGVGQGDALRDQLNLIFAQGLGAPGMQLDKVRLFDTQILLAVENAEGAQALAPELDRGLLSVLEARLGPERMQPASGLWRSALGPRYSTVIPLGEGRPEGYLELVIEPKARLGEIERLVRNPVRVQPAGAASEGVPRDHIVITQELRAIDGQPAYRLELLVPLQEIDEEILHTRMLILAADLVGAGFVLIVVYLLLDRLFLLPLRRMRDTIQSGITDDARLVAETRGFREFADLAEGFNTLMAKVRDQQARLESMSLTDALTGLANRRAFNLTLDREWGLARRNRRPISLLLIDIDFFKRYNDTYGHQAGDRCLAHIGQAIGANVSRASDLAARYGGEEFAVILPDTDAQGARHIAEQIAQGIRDLHIAHQGSEVAPHVTLSIGISACAPQSNIEESCFLECADRALYQAKTEGRDRIRTHEKPPGSYCPHRRVVAGP